MKEDGKGGGGGVGNGRRQKRRNSRERRKPLWLPCDSPYEPNTFADLSAVARFTMVVGQRFASAPCSSCAAVWVCGVCVCVSGRYPGRWKCSLVEKGKEFAREGSPSERGEGRRALAEPQKPTMKTHPISGYWYLRGQVVFWPLRAVSWPVVSADGQGYIGRGGVWLRPCWSAFGARAVGRSTF